MKPHNIYTIPSLKEGFTEMDSNKRHKWCMKEEFPGEHYKGVKTVGHWKEKQLSKSEISYKVFQAVASEGPW